MTRAGGIGTFLERRSLVLALGLVVIASIRIASTYRVFSFTIDEPGHFACGLEYLSKHVYRYLTEQPPLAQAAIALPPYLAGVRPLGGEEYNLEGRNVILRSRRPNRTLALMRLGILPFFWLACGVVYLWCRRHFAGAVAPLAVALFTLLPPVLAHAGLACTDMALAACLGAAFLALILWAESPASSRWKRGALLGVAAALAALSKFTALLYLPAAAAIVLLFYLAVERPGLRKLAALVRERAATFAFAVLVGALVIWAGYLFSFGKVPAWNIKLPAPEFFDGLLAAQSHNRRGRPSYLLGHYSLTGWWYYFPVALVKTPIAFLVLLALGTYTCCRKFSIAACRLPLAFCLGILLPAMTGQVDIGVRTSCRCTSAFRSLPQWDWTAWRARKAGSWARRQRSCFCYGWPARGPFAIPTTCHTSTNSPGASRPESWWTPISIGGRIPSGWAGAYGSWACKRFPSC